MVEPTERDSKRLSLSQRVTRSCDTEIQARLATLKVSVWRGLLIRLRLNLMFADTSITSQACLNDE
jgi:hypothetical protein